jgi:hypothetical protein
MSIELLLILFFIVIGGLIGNCTALYTFRKCNILFSKLIEDYNVCKERIKLLTNIADGLLAEMYSESNCNLCYHYSPTEHKCTKCHECCTGKFCSDWTHHLIFDKEESK